MGQDFGALRKGRWDTGVVVVVVVARWRMDFDDGGKMDGINLPRKSKLGENLCFGLLIVSLSLLPSLLLSP